ncbi:MAG: hypothetical protein LBD70_08855 [Bifidobacteriaceae bacterium]|jgi:hypothetical protein|nr:hypothetical protein [Bifidobacteriaceae bacterium]
MRPLGGEPEDPRKGIDLALKRLNRRVVLAALGCLLATPTLAACDQPSVAAVIGSRVVSQERLARLTDNYNLVFELIGGQGLTAQEILGQVIADQVSAEVLNSRADSSLAESVEIVTAAELAQLLTESYGVAEDLTAPILSLDQGSVDLILGSRIQVVAGALESAELTTEDVVAVLSEVRVNPRFGELVDIESLDTTPVPISPSWLISLDSLSADQADDSLDDGSGEIESNPEVAE